MKTRERIKAMQWNSGFWERMHLASDRYPGTEFDVFFSNLSAAWIILHPKHEGEIRNPTMKKTAQIIEWSDRADPSPSFRRQRAREDASYFQWVGQTLADIVVRGDSATLRDMAKALDEWTNHTPQPDPLREMMIIEASRLTRLGEPLTVKTLIACMKVFGIPVTPNTPRILRRIGKELGYQMNGKPGRPKKP